jgi:tetratricopeptide (TPR) repeat protein
MAPVTHTDSLVDTLADTLADTVASVATVVKPDSVLPDTMSPTVWGMDIRMFLLTVVLPIVAGLVIAIVVGFVFYLIGRKRGKQDQKKLKQDIIKELPKKFEEVLNRRFKGAPVYLNGLPETTEKDKAKLLSDALDAMNEYRHDDAIAKFGECLDLETDPSKRCAILNLIGLSQWIFGYTRDAEQSFLQMIQVAKEAELDDAFSDALINIGLIYHRLGNSKKSLESFGQALLLNRKRGNSRNQAIALGNIGLVYRGREDLQRSLKFHLRALKMNSKNKDLEGQSIDLGNIGLIYYYQKNFQKALECHQHAFEMAKQIENPPKRLRLLADNLNNIGNVYRAIGELDAALRSYFSALEIDEKIGNSEGKANQLANIGIVYLDLGNYMKVLDYLQRARELYVKIGAKLLVEQTDRNIAVAKEAMKK